MSMGGKTDRDTGERLRELEHALLSTDLQTKLPDLLRQLRANGVTRYKRGDFEIELSELSTAPVCTVESCPTRQVPIARADAPGLAAWLPEPDRKPRPGPAVAECPLPDEPQGPLPPFEELQKQSEHLRRQQAEDRSGVEVTEAE